MALPIGRYGANARRISPQRLLFSCFLSSSFFFSFFFYFGSCFIGCVVLSVQWQYIDAAPEWNRERRLSYRAPLCSKRCLAFLYTFLSPYNLWSCARYHDKKEGKERDGSSFSISVAKSQNNKRCPATRKAKKKRRHYDSLRATGNISYRPAVRFVEHLFPQLHICIHAQFPG